MRRGTHKKNKKGERSTKCSETSKEEARPETKAEKLFNSAGININIYAQKSRLKVSITADETHELNEMSHCLQEATEKEDEPREAQPVGT